MSTKARIMAVAAVAALVLAMTAPAGADSHPKATGSVEWTSSGGLAGIHTEFALHDRADDDVRGSYVYMTIPRSWGTEWRMITVECATVDGDTVRWGGHITASNSPDLVGDPIIGWAMDAATPGADGDSIGTWANSGKSLCGHTWTGGGTVTAGNLTVNS